MTLDWDRIDRWTALMQNDDVSELREVFAAGGARSPSIKWRPTVDDLKSHPMRFAWELWARAAVERVPTTRLVDPIALAPALGHLLVVDVVEGGRDFVYRLFGTYTAAVSGFDMTRKRLSDHPASPHIREFSMALYRATMLRREAVWSHYGPAMAVSTVAWERVILPLSDDSGAICRFLTATVAIGLDGVPLKG